MTLNFQESGVQGAPTIIFLHGMTMGGWMWTDQLNEFSRTYHCLAPDLPGHAGSSHVAWLSLSDTADKVAELIRDRAASGKAHLVGLSLGALVGLHLMVRHPQLVESALLSGAVAEIPRPKWLFNAQVRLIGRLLRSEFGIWLFGKMLHIPPEAWDVFHAGMKKLSLETWNGIYDELLDAALPEGLDRVTCEALCVTGAADLPINVRSVSIVAKKLPKASGWLAKDVHHGWNGENPSLFNAMTQAWLTGQPMPKDLVTLGA